MGHWKPEGIGGGPRLSAVMLVCDEGTTLERGLESIQPLRPEVVIGVDSRSSDTTLDIAQEYAHTLRRIDFTGNFAAARNELNELASGDWRLTMDGHEFIRPGHADRLREALLRANAQEAGGLAVRLMMSESEGGTIAGVLRLWRHVAGAAYVRPIHEQLEGLRPPIVGRPDIHLLHHRPAVRIERRREQRQTTDLDQLTAWAQKQTSEDPVTSWHLSQLYEQAENKPLARALARAAHAASSTKKPAFRTQIRVYLAREAADTGDLSGATDHALQALKDTWNCHEAYALLFRVSMERSDHHEAAHWLGTLMRIPSLPFEVPTPARYITWWPHQALSQLATAVGSHDRAARHDADAKLAAIENTEEIFGERYNLQ